MGAAQFFDIAAALILSALGFIGFLRGCIGAVMSFVGLSCGTYCAWKYSAEGTDLFLQYFPNIERSIASVAAMAIIFLGVAVLASLISKLLGSFVQFANLSGLNQLIGMFMGLGAGSALIIAAYAALTVITPESQNTWMGESIFLGFAEKFWPQVNEFLQSCGVDFTRLVSRSI